MLLLVILIVSLLYLIYINSDTYKVKKIFRELSEVNLVKSISVKIDGLYYLVDLKVIRSRYNPLITKECISDKEMLHEAVESVEINFMINNRVALSKINIMHHGSLKYTGFTLNNRYSLNELLMVTKELKSLSNK